MKKLFALGVLFFATIALAACNVTPEPDEETYALNIESDIDIVYNVTPDGPYTFGTDVEVTLESYEEGYAFTGWVDHDDALLSEDYRVELTIESDVYLEATFETIDDNDDDDEDNDTDNGEDDDTDNGEDEETEPALFYYTGFEDGEKAAYADGHVFLSDEQWFFADSLIGDLDDDQRVEDYSVRIRDGYIETDFAVSGVYRISFMYGRYLGDDPSDVMFHVSTDQDEWIQIGETLTATETFETFELTFDETLYDAHDFTVEDALYFRISADKDDERVNIDEFEIHTIDGDTPPADDNDNDDDNDEDNDTDNGETGEVPDHIDTDLLEMELDPYYESVEGLWGEELINGLRAILWEDLNYETYGEARYILQETDQDPDNPDNVIQLYTRDSVLGDWGDPWYGIWNREHVWPQAALTEPTSGNTSTGQGSDLHNLTPADPDENNYRGNKYFDESGNGSSYTPHDEAKGIVARILFYMDVMYDDLTVVSGAANVDNYEMGDLDYLLQWNVTFGPDAFEHNRNDIIESYQGNRNPFIDYPHFAELIWHDHPFFMD